MNPQAIKHTFRAFVLVFISSSVFALFGLQGALGSETLPQLRTRVVVDSDVVTVGDFFENAGALSDTPLFRSPDLGKSGKLRSLSIVKAAQRAGIGSIAPVYAGEVIITRKGLEIDTEMITGAISGALRQKLGAEDAAHLEVRLEDFKDNIYVSPDASRSLKVVGIRASNNGSRFRAVLSAGRAGEEKRFEVRGSGQVMVEVHTLDQGLDRGEILSEDHISSRLVPASRRRGKSTDDPAALIGMQAVRSLNRGAVLNDRDFRPPRVVKKGDTVTLEHTRGNFSVTLLAEAQQDGAIGETIGFKNARSNRTIKAEIIDAGYARVMTPRTTIQTSSVRDTSRSR